MFRRLASGSFVVLFAAVMLAAQQQAPPTPREPRGAPEQGRGATAAQQRPVFRGGTHFVRVDAYPIQDGKVIENLKAEDFEILEDGKPQQIDSLDFVRFDTFTPEVERRDPSTRREGFDLAADPRYRVFVIFVDMNFNRSAGAHEAQYDLPQIQRPLGQFLDRVLGPRDLYGFLTSRNSVNDLVLGRKSTVIQSQLADLFRSSLIDRDDADVLDGCDCAPGTDPKVCEAIIAAMKTRHRADATYTTLDGLVVQLGAIRQERKNVVFVSNLLPRWRPNPKVLETRGPMLPRAGITQGRIGVGDRSNPGGNNESFCASEFQRLANMDFEQRFRMLLETARRDNVSFYNITPAGLQATVTVADANAVKEATDSLVSLANDTDGIAVVNTNDLGGGMKRIADDLAAYYVLGYYTTNTKFDGRVRNIKVRLKPSGTTIRARRQYRAPTEAEIAALAASASPPAGGSASAPTGPSAREMALAVLERASRPFAVYTAIAGNELTVVAELSAASIQAGRWKEGAAVQIVLSAADGSEIVRSHGGIGPGVYAAMGDISLTGKIPARVSVRLTGSNTTAHEDWVKIEDAPGKLVGDAVAYRSGSRSAERPVAAFEFARNERIRIRWPALATLDRREVKLLDRHGKALPVDLPLSEDVADRSIGLEMSLSGLPRGDYLFELTAGAGSATERRLLAIRIK
jgi:VWFA-related protein